MSEQEFCVTRLCGSFKMPGLTVCWEHAEKATVIRMLLDDNAMLRKRSLELEQRLNKLEDRIDSVVRTAIQVMGSTTRS